MILRHIIILYMQSTFTTSKHSSHSYSCHSSLYTLHLFLVFCWNFIPFEDWFCQVRNCDNISELLNFIKPFCRCVLGCPGLGVSKLFYLSAVIRVVPTTTTWFSLGCFTKMPDMTIFSFSCHWTDDILSYRGRMVPSRY